MMRAFLSGIALCVILTNPVQAATLKLELARGQVDITTGFDGTNVVVFGVTDTPDGAIGVTLKGPEKTVVVRHKTRVAGAWMNTEAVEFRRVPSYYDYALSPGAETVTGAEEAMAASQIGIQNLDFYPEEASGDPAQIEAFRTALVTRNQRTGFYPIRSGRVETISPGFFKVTFELPPGVPTGNYTLEGVLIEDGAIAVREIRSLQVGQVGFNAKVWLFAMNNAVLYGLMTIVIALGSGWAAFTFLRRD